MRLAVYRKKDGTLVKYACREIKKGFFIRTGLFDGDVEVSPEDRGEKFVKYEE